MTTTALDRLAEMEALEFRAVDVLARGNIRADIRASIVKGLGQLRTAKHRLLANDQTLLRKSAATAPAAEPAGRRVFESPHHAGMDLLHNSSRGMRTFSIPANGKIDLAGGDHEGHAFLRGRGFRDCGPMIEDCGKTSAADILAMFKPARLQRLSAPPFVRGAGAK